MGAVGGRRKCLYVVEAAEDMPVPQLSQRALRAFIAAQHREGVHRRPVNIVPRLCLFTLGFHCSYKYAVKSVFL
jgi:hypothetical protein